MKKKEKKQEKEMIQLNKDYYPIVYITFKDSDWNIEDYNNLMRIIENDLIDTIKKKETIKLMIAGNPGITIIPPFQYCSWVVKDLVRIRHKLAEALDKTAIFKPDDRLNFFFTMLFKLYKPVKPLQMFNNYDEAFTWLIA
jgi:hypothetical protein